MAIHIDKMTVIDKWFYIHRRFDEVETTEQDWEVLNSLYYDLTELTNKEKNNA